MQSPDLSQLSPVERTFALFEMAIEERVAHMERVADTPAGRAPRDFSTPEKLFETLDAAIAIGDVATFKAAFTPEFCASTGLAAAEAADVRRSLAYMTEPRASLIEGVKMNGTDGEGVPTRVYVMTDDASAYDMTLKKLDGEWKIAA